LASRDGREREWQRAKALFESALEHAPDHRAAFVSSAVGNDEELRREVESLLRADAAGVSVLDRLPLADAAVIAAGTRDLASGDGRPLQSRLERDHFVIIGLLDSRATAAT
jgi:hypothetical protein